MKATIHAPPAATRKNAGPVPKAVASRSGLTPRLADKTARDLMTDDPVVLDAQATLRSAAETLSTRDIRHLPVVDGSRVIGMLSDRDLYAVVWTEGGTDADKWRRSVHSVMNTNVVSAAPDATLTEVIDLLLENRIGAVPVIDEARDDLLGIVSYVDVLRAIREAAGE